MNNDKQPLLEEVKAVEQALIELNNATVEYKRQIEIAKLQYSIQQTINNPIQS